MCWCDWLNKWLYTYNGALLLFVLIRSHVQLLHDPWTVRQAPLSMELSNKTTELGSHFLLQNLPWPESNPYLLHCASRFFTEPSGNPYDGILVSNEKEWMLVHGTIWITQMMLNQKIKGTKTNKKAPRCYISYVLSL